MEDGAARRFFKYPLPYLEFGSRRDGWGMESNRLMGIGSS